jgi:hypothetical protein
MVLVSQGCENITGNICKQLGLALIEPERKKGQMGHTSVVTALDEQKLRLPRKAPMGMCILSLLNPLSALD